jgi:peptidoglycan hydrolase-like protein with peptidoglycan-binding domain
MRKHLTAILVFGLVLAAPAAGATGVPGEAINNPLPPDLLPGSVGPTVADLQGRLLDAGFFPGRTDGVYGRQTVGAVLAFQKLYDLERTGIFRQDDWHLLGREITGPGPGPEPDRIEVDLRRQVLYLIEAESVAGVFPISSANGESYRNARGRLIRAVTPEGRFEFRRSRQGWWESYLGFLYSPFYFYGGYALHGSNSVPAFPASHGCVRVEIEDMDFLKTRIELGMPIYLYGHSVSRDELITPLITP